MKNKPVCCVTGSAGFIGSNLCDRLTKEGYVVLGIDNLKFGYAYNNNEIISTRTIDFADIEQEDLDRCDMLLHLSTSNIIFAEGNENEVFLNNAINTIKLFKRFKGKIVYAGTSSIYGNADVIPTPETAEHKPSNSYDMSKWLASEFLKQRGNYTELVLTNTYGENQWPDHKYSGVIGKLIGQALNSQPLQVIQGQQTRDFTYVQDVVDAFVLAIEQEAKNCSINIGTGIETTLIDLAQAINELASFSRMEVEIIPSRSIDKIMRRCLLIEKATYELGWYPKTDLFHGLMKTIQWQIKAYHNK